MSDDTFLMAYADDEGVVISARDAEYAKRKLNLFTPRVSCWMEDHGLSLVLTRRQVPGGGHQVSAT